KEEFVRKSFYEKTSDTKYAVLQGIVENTFKEKEDDLQPISTSKIIKQFNNELDANEVEELINESEKMPNMTLNDRVFMKGFWCFDTPGTVNKQQLEYKDFLIENDFYLENDERGIADIVLSSLGWVLVTTKMSCINIRAWTPSGRGLITRQPPILPYAAAYRGRKIYGTSTFQTRKLAEIETFSHTQRSVKPGKIVGTNYEIDSSYNEPYRFVNFDIV
uniref:Uncharacterized protein n=1 Tax=Meloidogyne javanica TaxID=6303 RepID=A0A915LZA1_MELJA